MRKLFIGVLVCVVLAVVGVGLAGSRLTTPHQGFVGEPPDDLNAESVLIPRADAPPIAGWFAPGRLRHGGVLLLHGVRSDRREMLGRARFLLKRGYSVLLIDMQAHGETPGDYISFGHFESRDARDALRFLRSRLPGLPIGVLGVSLGGAAALLGSGPLPADAVILEAVYSSIDHAVQNRLAIRLGELGRYLAPLLLWQLEPRLGVSVKKLSPVSAISRLNAPVMIIAGSDDRHTLLHESEELFRRAPVPKIRWIVDGAKHQNLHRFMPEQYERNVLEFFDKYLDGPAG